MAPAENTATLTGPLFVDSKGRAVAAPDFGGVPVADTHAHLDMLDDPALALARAALAGVDFVATVADASEDAERTYEQLPQWLADAEAMLTDAAASEGRVGGRAAGGPHHRRRPSAQRQGPYTSSRG